MNFDGAQKKFIKKNIHKLSLKEISKRLNIDENEIISYLREKWGGRRTDAFLKARSNNKETAKIKKSKITLLLNILLVVLTIIVYANSLTNGFVSDDIQVILKNNQIGNLNSVFSNPSIFISPLLYFVIYKLFGLSAVVFRMINILLHIANVILVFNIVALFSNPFIAFATASFFSVHPLTIEAVGWISGGPYVRYSFFLLMSLFLYIKQKKRNYFWYALIFFVFSLFSSDKAIVVPLFFLLYEIVFGEVREIGVFGVVKKLTPYFAIAGCWVLFYMTQLGGRISGLSNQTYSQVRMLNPFVQIPIAITSYLQLIFWPDKLTLYHSEMFFGPLNFTIRVIGLIGIIGVIGWAWFKNKQIFFWLSFFIISLLPTLTPFGISWIVAERYVYLGLIGVLFVVSYLLFFLIKNKKTEGLGYLIFIICLIGLMARTIVRNADWKNEDTLWTSMITTSPSDPKTHNNLGDMYGRQGNPKKAEEEFKKAISLNPNYADAYHNLANTYITMKKYDLALKNYEKAVSINPNLWQSYQNMAAIYFSANNLDLAKKNMEKAIMINPKDSSLYLNLAIVYLKSGDKATGRSAALKALELDPGNEKIKQMLIEIDKK